MSFGFFLEKRIKYAYCLILSYRYNKNSNGLKCSYFEVIKVTQFFEFFNSKIIKQNLKNFVDFVLQNQLRLSN